MCKGNVSNVGFLLPSCVWWVVEFFLCCFIYAGCCCFNHPTWEQEKANKYYAEVNRAKYTAERKRHLSSLLGSSAAHELPLSNPESRGATGSLTADTPSQTKRPLMYSQSNGSKEATLVSERLPTLNQNGVRLSDLKDERHCINALTPSVRKNGYNRGILAGPNSRIETEEELAALIHSTADRDVRQKQLLWIHSIHFV